MKKLLIMISLMLLLVGCSQVSSLIPGKVTADSLLQSYLKKYQNVEDMRASMEMNMDISMDIMGQSSAVKSETLMEIEAITDKIAHVAGEINATNYDGETPVTEKTLTEVYSVKDGNKFIVYQ